MDSRIEARKWYEDAKKGARNSDVYHFITERIKLAHKLYDVGACKVEVNLNEHDVFYITLPKSANAIVTVLVAVANAKPESVCSFGECDKILVKVTLKS